MPISLKDYPSNWKTEIVPRILERDKGRCVHCGLENYSVGKRMSDGTFQQIGIAESWKEGRIVTMAAEMETGEKHIVIVLMCAHLHNPDPMDCRDENLVMLCQACHLKWDSYLHATRAQATYAKKREAAALKKRPFFTAKAAAVLRRKALLTDLEYDIF